jgi:methionine-rich copper-binding protein CopC
MKNLSIVILLVFSWSNTVSAHTALTKSNPLDGEMMSSPPEVIHLEFTESVRLLRAKLILTRDGATQDIALEFKPSSSARGEHSVNLPNLEKGLYQFEWSVIGADGHPVQGTVAFGIDVEVSTSNESHDEHHTGH